MHQCDRCKADPQPSNFGSPRECAFNEDGTFNPRNWNCATIAAIMATGKEVEAYGDDETAQIYPFYYGDDGDLSSWGFVVLTRYKQGGKTDSAVWVGMFWPARPLTIEISESFINRVEPLNLKGRY